LFRIHVEQLPRNRWPPTTGSKLALEATMTNKPNQWPRTFMLTSDPTAPHTLRGHLTHSYTFQE
jgi:hypothetical protein